MSNNDLEMEAGSDIIDDETKPSDPDLLQKLDAVKEGERLKDVAQIILEEHVRLIHEKVEMAFEERRQDEIDSRLLSMHAGLFEKATVYNNTVVTIGYAGFFAIWSFTSDAIPENDTNLIAALLGISLLTFVSWTLFASLLSAANVRRIAPVYLKEFSSRSERIAAIIEKERQGDVALMRVNAIWPYIFAISAISGFLAGILLIIHAIAKATSVDLKMLDAISVLF